MISLLQLQYFQAVAQTGNLTQVAKTLHISQTTLSVMLTKLENELGVQLFDRRKSRIYLNSYGAAFLKHANIALDALNQGQQEITRMLEQESMTLSLCTSSEYTWESTILLFSSKYPEIHIAHHHDQMSLFVEGLLNQQFDFIIAGEDDIQSKDLEYRIIRNRSLCLCLPLSHPLADRKSISLSELGNIPMVNLTHDKPFQQFTNKLFAKAGISPPSAVECGYWMRSRFTSQGLGGAIINDIKVCRDNFPDHAFIPISDEFAHRNMALYWCKNRKFTTAMQKFFNFLGAHPFDDMVEEKC